jgi:preprotein translocase subunit YajC
MALSTEQKQKAKKIINIITTAIFAVVFVCLVVVFVMVSVQRKNNKDVKIFGHYMLAVLTDSMSPTIEPNEVIWSKAFEEDDIDQLIDEYKQDNSHMDGNILVFDKEKGPIVTFTAPSGPLKGHNETHRISRVVYDESGNIQKIYTKGDHEQSEDSWTIKAEDIKAVFVRKLPLVSGIMAFVITNPFLAYVTLIAVPLLLVAIMFIVGFVKDRLQKQREEEGKDVVESTNLADLTDEDKKKLLEAYLSKAKESKIPTEDVESNVDLNEEDDQNN